MAFYWAPRCSSCLTVILGTEVDDAWDGSWRCCFVVWLYLVAKPGHVGSIWMGLPTPCTVLRLVAIRQGDRASCQALSCPVTVVGGGASPGDVKPPGLDIWWSIEHMGTYATKSYME
jgi:hypothetical protein